MLKFDSLTNGQKQRLRILLLVFNKKSKIVYLNFDYLINSQKLYCLMQKKVQQELVHTWQFIQHNKIK